MTFAARNSTKANKIGIRPSGPGPLNEESSSALGFDTRRATTTVGAAEPRSVDRRRVLEPLQRTYGNQAVLRMLGGAGLADGSINRKCDCNSAGGCPECGNKHQAAVSRWTDRGSTQQAVPSSVQDALSAPGQPLDAKTRRLFEPRFGYDFSAVRVHTDERAAESAREVNALAYTVGREMVFARDQFRSTTAEGRRLLAHELAHVVQQRDSADSGARPSRISSPSETSEHEAERAADAVMAGLTVDVPPSQTAVSRYGHRDCSEENLRNFVWPSDWVAKQMVAKAIRVLAAHPIDPAVTPLLKRYFMTATPNLATIRGVYNSIQADFTADNYTYECETECDEVEAAYVRHRLRYVGVTPTIHLCMTVLSTYARDCIASIIVHEFSHYSAHTDDKSGCYASCDTAGCAAGFSASDALDNASSYANFALELFPLPV